MVENFLKFTFSEADVQRAVEIYRAQETYSVGKASSVDASDMVVYVADHQIQCLRHLLQASGHQTIEYLREKIAVRKWQRDLVRSFLTLVVDSSNPRPFEMVHLGLWQDLIKEPLRQKPQLQVILNRFMIPSNVHNQRELLNYGIFDTLTPH